MRSLLQYFVCVLSGQVFDVGVGVSLAFVQQVEYIEIKTRISYAVLNWFTCPTSPAVSYTHLTLPTKVNV